MATIGTMVYTYLFSKYVGEDPFGNKYYISRYRNNDGDLTRSVIYNGIDEPSKVPPMYHAWLHYMTNDFPLKEAIRNYSWQKEHRPNLTGTEGAYYPEGHILRGAKRAKSTGDYVPWTPGTEERK
jgi:NADH:ubiquinone oxidoreductase subunit